MQIRLYVRVPCKEPLLQNKQQQQNPKKMASAGGRSRTGSESNTGFICATTHTPRDSSDDCAEVTLFEDTSDVGGRLPDLVAGSKCFDSSGEPLESYLAITIQVAIPFLVAGLGMVGAGLVLDLVQVRIMLREIALTSMLTIVTPSRYHLH